MERENLRIALIKLGTVHEAMANYARNCAHAISTDIFQHDFAPFINLMGVHGDPDYQKDELSCRHVDCRETKLKKKAVRS